MSVQKTVYIYGWLQSVCRSVSFPDDDPQFFSCDEDGHHYWKLRIVDQAGIGHEVVAPKSIGPNPISTLGKWVEAAVLVDDKTLEFNHGPVTFEWREVSRLTERE